MIGFSTRLELPFGETVPLVTQALQNEGFGILSDIDVQATLKTKLDVDGRPYRILGACNPPFAHRAITADPLIGLLLPCNVVVRELDDGSTSVDFMSPKAVLHLVDNPEIADIAGEVQARLERVRDALSVGLDRRRS